MSGILGVMNASRLLADSAQRLLYKMNSAKETKIRRYCKGNLLDCIRLVRDYSTDLVAIQLQSWRHPVSKIKKETASAATGSFCLGNPTEPMP